MTDKFRWHKVNFLTFTDGADEYGEEGRMFVKAHGSDVAIKKVLTALRERNPNAGIGIISVETYNPNHKIDFKKVSKFDGPHYMLKGS